ncbi:MAG: hypothetical protein ABS69_16460 [Nitrosomonadales bacterium SCN 54-20]|nr:MAG: hypothetical protein ABS69_16460 [Nitrosomonadales bacterium SCN 54-20]
MSILAMQKLIRECFTAWFTRSVEFVLAFNASESRCMEATGFVWSIESVYCIASIVVSDGEYSFELSGSIT